MPTYMIQSCTQKNNKNVLNVLISQLYVFILHFIQTLNSLNVIFLELCHIINL